jgi:thiol-disulfide isomerase/thioredoxin
MSAPCFSQNTSGIPPLINPGFPPKEIQQAISTKDFDGALKLIDENKELSLSAQIMSRTQLGAALMQANRREDAFAQLDKACTLAIQAAKDGQINTQNLVSTVMLSSNLGRMVDADKSAKWVADSLDIVKSKVSSDELSQEHRLLLDLMRMKMQSGDPAQAEASKNAMLEHVAKCEELFAKDSSNPSKVSLMISLWLSQMQLADPDLVEKTYEKATKLAEGAIEKAASPTTVSSYTSIVTNYVSRTARNAPDSASKALESAKTFLDRIKSEDEKVVQAIEGFLKNTKNMERSIESSKRLLSMIGKPAPEIDPMEWVNGEPLSTLGDLKGRVVLIDFWAVWCGPCVATFPHLKHLDAEYKEKGLTILGVTRQYNMRWDESKENYGRSDTPVELADEMSMLEKFVAKHELTHRTMVTPEKSDMQARYAVTGIPHAVVIDKQGIVRLVKVGSGSQNAEEIESMIKKLLAEKP